MNWIGVNDRAIAPGATDRGENSLHRRVEHDGVEWIEKIENGRIVRNIESTCIGVDDEPLRACLLFAVIIAAHVLPGCRAKGRRQLNSDDLSQRQFRGKQERTSQAASEIDECSIAQVDLRSEERRVGKEW